MASTTVAVIAALRAVLHEVESGTLGNFCQPDIVNRWIDELPGAWWGRWQGLRLPDHTSVSRNNVISHVRATLAYLEAREVLVADGHAWWPFGKFKSEGVSKETASTEQASIAQVPQRDEHVSSSTRTKWLN